MRTEYDWCDRLPTLTAERLSLRWLTEADVPDLYAVFSDPEVDGLLRRLHRARNPE